MCVCVCACMCVCVCVCVCEHTCLLWLVPLPVYNLVVVGRNRHYLHVCFDMKAFALLWLFFIEYVGLVQLFIPVAIMTWMLQMHPGSTF